MKSINTMTLLAFGLAAFLLPGAAMAQTPDCSGQGPNLVGLVWPNGQFSYTAQPYEQVIGTLYIFNPSGGDVRGWEMNLDYPSSSLYYLGSTLYGDAINVGMNGDFIVGLGSPLEPDDNGAVALGTFSFMPTAVTQLDFFAIPTNPASFPDNMAMLTGEDSEMVMMYPVGGAGNPIANINGPPLNYCEGAPNQNPVAVDDQFEVQEDGSAMLAPLDNDYDPDGTLIPQSLVFLSGPSEGGEFSINSDGTVDYSPRADFSGVETIQYRVSDNDGFPSNPALISITVTPVDDPPVAVPETIDTDEDVPVTVNVLANDYDVDSTLNPASLQLGDPVNGGLVEHDGQGNVTYTPALNYFGADYFTYTISDESGIVSNAVTDTVFITSVNDLPVAADDQFATLEDTPVVLTPLGNDTDVDGSVDPTAITFVGESSAGGLFVAVGDGTVQYTPAADYFGPDSIAYTVADNEGGVSDEAVIAVSVTPVNDAPVALNDAAETPEDTALWFGVTGNDYDVDSELDFASLQLGEPVQGGTVEHDGLGNVYYTPAPDFFGEDTFTYTLSDVEGAVSDPATCTIVVTPVNDPPVAVDDSAETLEDQPLTFDVLGNDFDIDGEVDPGYLQFTSASGAGGAFVYNYDGTVTYTPPLDFFGTDNITYQVPDDSEALSNEAVITIDVIAVNDPPVVVSEATATPEDTAIDWYLVGNDYDVDSELDLTSLQLGTPAQGGTVEDQGDGMVRYTPAPDFFGTDWFTYTLADVEGEFAASVIDTVFVYPVNDPPVAHNDTTFTQMDVPVEFDVLANDLDIDGALDPGSLELGQPSQGGVFTHLADGIVRYEPATAFVGTETCGYLVSDDQGLPCAEPGLIVVHVNEVADNPPVFADIPDQTVPLGDAWPLLDLTTYVTDEDVAGLAWQASGYQQLSVALTDGVAQVRTADPSWWGHEVITFTATDGAGQSGSVDVIFLVTNQYQFWVEVLSQGQEVFYTAAAPGASDGFDPLFDRVYPGTGPTLRFSRPAGWDSYAYVRHNLEGSEADVAMTYLDGELYEIPFGRYRPVPLGEFCIYECIWNDDTQQYDCGLDCQYQLEGGKAYTLVFDPQGTWADVMLVQDEALPDFLADTRAGYDGTQEQREWNFDVVFDNDLSDVPATSTLQFFTSFASDAGIGMRLWDETEGTLVDLVHADQYAYEVPGGVVDTRSFTFYLGTAGVSGDTDGDGVPDDVDQCPTEDASFFDRDGDGCIDPVIGGRHIEYWADGTFPLAYVAHQAGVPDIADGSDFAAIENGFGAWDQIAGCEVTTSYLGTTDNPIANSHDGVNTVTFSDDEYLFPSGVIAVGLSTSYLTPDYENGIRPGQIFDTDMIFNPVMDFRTETAGDPEGIYLEGVVVHEAGHMLGLSHSGVQTSTMFYVLPPDSTATSLEVEDRLAMMRCYHDDATLTGASHLQGTVTDGWTGEPVAGAIVFAISTATGDTAACDYTLPDDGSYHFLGLPDGTYHLAIHPLDGSSSVGYLSPGNINSLINATADVLFVPEYWDSAESSTDDSAAASPLTVSAGLTTEAHLTTNIDLTGPSVVAVSPADGASGLPIGVAILARFDEAIDPGSLPGNFNFSQQGVGDLILGNASLLEDGHTLAYVPTVNLLFETTYVLDLGAGITDLYGNPMGADFSASFATEIQPPVALNNLLPRKGVAGSILVINGAGFAADPGGNTVNFGEASWVVLDASASQLVVQVPEDAALGTANVQVTAFGETSNALSYTVLASGGEAHGLVTATVDLFALPRRVEVGPEGDDVFVATDQGLSFVDVSDPTAPVAGSLAVTGGLNRLAVTPDGQTIYAISKPAQALYRLGTDPVAELQSVALDFLPKGILVAPSGQRAYLATDYREIQIWDTNEASLTFMTQVGALLAPDPNLLGAMTCDPAGDRLLALTGAGKLLVFDLETGAVTAQVDVLSDPRDVVVDPRGERAYVTDSAGQVSLVSLTSFSRFLDIPTGGELRGAGFDPMGTFLYAANRQLDNLDVIDLRSDSPTYRTISTRIAQPTNPLDVTLAPDGLYAYTICESDRQLTVSSVGTGPVLASLSRRSGPVGSTVVLAGAGFAGGNVSFNGVPAVIERGDDTTLVVSVPAGAVSGPVMVLGAEPGEVSGAIEFQVVSAGPDGNLRLAASASPAGGPGLTGTLAVASTDRVVALGGQDGRVHLLDIDQNGSHYNQFTAQTDPLDGPVADLAVAPDGRSVFAVTGPSATVFQLDIDPASDTFGTVLQISSLDASEAVSLAVSPDGRQVLACDPGGGQVVLTDWGGGGGAVYLEASPTVAAYHPAGRYAYVGAGYVVAVIDLDPASDTYFQAVVFEDFDELVSDLAFSPDGDLCRVLVRPGSGSGNRRLTTLDTTDPAAPVYGGAWVIPSAAATAPEQMALNPAGDQALIGLQAEGLVLVDLTTGAVTPQPALVDASQDVGVGFTATGLRAYAVSEEDGTVAALDFNGQQQMAKVWGDGQEARASEDLDSTLRVRVTDPATGEGLAGVPVTFSIDTEGKLQSTYTRSPVFEPMKLPAGVKKTPVSFAALKTGDKQGGEDLGDATVIPGLPYTDTGTTEGHLDDYDETCPYPAPGSPDVVYLWTADFTGSVAVDLCGSAFDTKLYVYADAVTPGAPWACNDDYYDAASGCGEFVSFIEDMFVYEGVTYIIVVDGYGGEAGAYDLNMTLNYESTRWGYFTTADPEARPTTLTVSSNSLGFAEVRMNLGLNLGDRSVDVNSLGTAGSPLQFTETAVADPEDITFELVESKFAPQDGAAGVAVSTAVQVTFSKAADTATITAATFHLTDSGGSAVPAAMGFAGDNTTASLTPAGSLQYGTTYQVTVGAGILSQWGEPLADPQAFTFTTAAAPPAPLLTGVAPPGGPQLAPVVISGSGFSPVASLNAVYFGGVPATVTSAEPDFLLTKVPLGVGEGTLDIQVTVDGQPTNTLAFSVFEPTTDGADEVVYRVPTGSGTKAATVSPDGAVLYAVAADADLVIPVDMIEFETVPSIPVGDMPWAIDSHPDGDLVYVCNRVSGDVSVIDTDPLSPTYHQAVATIEVGTEPVDILVTPAGDRVLVANEVSEDLSVIDGDSESSTFNAVVTRVPVGSSARAVTVSPDGALIYLGTDDGYIVIGSVDYGVVRTVPTGSSARAVTVSPDGALLVLVDTDGGVTVFDIAAGSATMDQVVARVPLTSGAKAATVSPDGARLYAVMEEDDQINVYALDIGSYAEAQEDYTTRPVTELTLLQELSAGEDPQVVVFDPSDVTRFLVPNAGDSSLSVFDDEVPVGFGDGPGGVVQGQLTAGPELSLAGGRVTLYAVGSGEMAASVITDSEGRFNASLPAGRYVASLSAPQGVVASAEEQLVEVTAGQLAGCNWTVEAGSPDTPVQTMAWWKHDLAIVLRGWGEAAENGPALCGYLETGVDPALGQLAVLGDLVGSECDQQLQALRQLFNYPGQWTPAARTRQQLAAVVLNTASGRLAVDQAVSEDGATLAQTLAWVDFLLADEDAANDAEAWSVARCLNQGVTVAAGVIAEEFRDAFYSPVATHFHLDQNYPNPFNPECRIRFGVPKPGLVRLKIFDVSGRLVRTLVDDNLAVGTYIKVWDGTDNGGRQAASGVYFYKMQTADFTRTRKMLLLK